MTTPAEGPARLRAAAASVSSTCSAAPHAVRLLTVFGSAAAVRHVARFAADRAT